MHIKLTTGVFVFALGAAASAAADELDELKALVRAQAARIVALEQKVEALTQTIATTGAKVERAEMKFEAVRDTAEVAKQTSEETRRALADNKSVVTTDSKFKVIFSGGVNRQVTFAGDGNTTNFYQTDSGNSPSRVRVDATAGVAPQVALGATVELGVQPNNPTTVSQDDEEQGDADVKGRIVEAFVDSERYGRLSVGRGWAASFWLPEVDLSETQVVSLLTVGNLFGGLKFYSKDINDLTDIRVRDIFVDSERVLRNNRIRYDSPFFKGFRLSGTLASDERADAALRTQHKIGDFSLVSAASYQHNTFRDIDWRVDAGVSGRHEPTGLNLTLAAFVEKQDGDERHADGFIVKGGWRTDLFSIGKTSTSIDFLKNHDAAARGDTGTSMGAFLVQRWDRYNLDLYGGYRFYDLDRRTIDTDTIHMGTLGTRYRF